MKCISYEALPVEAWLEEDNLVLNEYSIKCTHIELNESFIFP